ncbi:hypothetical protein OIU74_025633 [Salix koriyanagi]|uniref:Uncharacterized protein n=1 Tax=Salix koriyanagi TaxID=2511006 RepID=A0A9Q1A5U3_9ROSI|nr:hypothetical protein OIU74_025633 [Salix koriyanagi]
MFLPIFLGSSEKNPLNYGSSWNLIGYLALPEKSRFLASSLDNVQQSSPFFLQFPICKRHHTLSDAMFMLIPLCIEILEDHIFYN